LKGFSGDIRAKIHLANMTAIELMIKIEQLLAREDPQTASAALDLAQTLIHHRQIQTDQDNEKNAGNLGGKGSTCRTSSRRPVSSAAKP
jgi:hypothetical protein